MGVLSSGDIVLAHCTRESSCELCEQSSVKHLVRDSGRASRVTFKKSQDNRRMKVFA